MLKERFKQWLEEHPPSSSEATSPGAEAEEDTTSSDALSAASPSEDTTHHTSPNPENHSNCHHSDSAPDTAGPLLQDALSYVEEVKLAFVDQPHIYNAFLDILKDYPSQT